MDRKTVYGFDEVAEDASATQAEMELLYGLAGTAIRLVGLAVLDTAIDMDAADQDDYENVVAVIKCGKQQFEELQKLEAERREKKKAP